MFSEYNKEVYEELLHVQNISRDEGKEVINTVLEHVDDRDYDLDVIESLIINTFRDSFCDDDLGEYKQNIIKILEEL
tara:strand:- start:1051 stop:1281 length:231 start_codon:yes stop_codon:yes gene_type:complete